MATKTKKTTAKKNGSTDTAMFVVSYRKYLTWKATHVFETEAAAYAFADNAELRDNLAYKVERVEYMG